MTKSTGVRMLHRSVGRFSYYSAMSMYRSRILEALQGILVNHSGQSVPNKSEARQDRPAWPRCAARRSCRSPGINAGHSFWNKWLQFDVDTSQ